MNNPKLRYLGILSVLCLCLSPIELVYGQQASPTPFLQANATWADTTLANMTIDEKVGQLFILKGTENNSDHLIELVKEIQPSGILMQGVSVHNYITAINRARRNSTIPLLELSTQNIAINNQFSDLNHFPSTASLSAVDNEPLKSSLFQKLVKDYNTLGINCSFSPSIQHFEEGAGVYPSTNHEANPTSVYNRAARQVAELRHHTILSILKGVKLPNDSIKEATLIKEDYFTTYQSLIEKGLTGIYLEEEIFKGDSIHLRQPNFFKKFVQSRLNFNGLLIAEISERYGFLDFFYAGADTYIVDESQLFATVKQVKYLIENEKIHLAAIDKKVRKILLSKSTLGLDQQTPEQLERKTVIRKIRNISDDYLKELYEQAIVFGNDGKNIIPLSTTYGTARQVIHVGSRKLRTFQSTLFQYVNCIPKVYAPNKEGLLEPISFDDSKESVYIIAIDQVNLSVEKHQGFIDSVHELNKKNEVAIVNFGNPLNLRLFNSSIAVLQLFDRNNYTEQLAAQILFGSSIANGRMPLNISLNIPYGHRGEVEVTRLKHASPQQAGIDAAQLYRIDDIVANAIDRKAMPGCQVLVARKGSIIYSKSFGFHTYDNRQRVERSDLYDIASVTKVAATTLAMMKLYEEKKVQIQQPLGTQMALSHRSTLENITVKDLLIHKSGLQRNMPIGRFLTNRNIEECTRYFCEKKSASHSAQIANNFYMTPSIQSDIWERVNQLERPDKYKFRKFLYGDVNFYILQQLVEQRTKMGLDQYISKNFYEPLGLRYCLYNPLSRLPETMITPTEYDEKWRNSLLRGYVHDETAALQGGVGGNAGLFANAEDLAILFQMLLNGGTYGGQQYLKKSTINFFTSADHGNHRGLGFDKPGQTYPISKEASLASYGHAGFTGTCVWVDPNEELIFIFLSNRVHPNKNNSNLMRQGVRRKIHQVIYDAIQPASKEEMLFVNLEGAE